MFQCQYCFVLWRESSEIPHMEIVAPCTVEGTEYNENGIIEKTPDIHCTLRKETKKYHGHTVVKDAVENKKENQTLKLFIT